MINIVGNKLIVTDRFGDSVSFLNCRDGSILVDGEPEEFPVGVAFLQEDVVQLRNFLNKVIQWREDHRW